MSVVVEPKDREEFERYCHEENIEIRHVADVTDSGRMRMFYNGELVADLKREFIDSAGARHFAKAHIGSIENRDPFKREIAGNGLREQFLNNLEDENVTSQKGLIEMFDSSIGASTVLMPFGGSTQGTETQASVQKLPVGSHHTNTASVMTFGFNPYISSWSPFHGAAYAVVEALTKATAAGADFRRLRFSFQEYFERMNSEESWGKPLAALLGALEMQLAFGLAAIGGKDSMSGTFNDINVPPTLIAFAAGTVDARNVISPEFKAAGNNVYIIRHNPEKDLTPDTAQLILNFENVRKGIESGDIVSAWSVSFGGVGEGIAKMSFGNGVGADVKVSDKDLFDFGHGSMIVESKTELNFPNAEFIGKTVEGKLLINGEEISIGEAFEANRGRFTKVYPDRSGVEGKIENASSSENTSRWQGEKTEHPVVFLPLFPGTNCDYDMTKAFEREGAEVRSSVFINLTAEDIKRSVEEMARNIDECHILALSGGFSAGDEPDGSGKFIANVLLNDTVKAAIKRLQDRGGLILGICNGFQALVKSGLLPYGKIGEVSAESPTLFHNDINRHISQIVSTRVGSVASPWLEGFEIGELHSIAASHGEGKFMASAELAAELRANGQIAFQYADAEGNATMTSPANPNGSTEAIEGIISPDGRILGKMGHSERFADGLMKNIHGNKMQNLFRNAINYFR